MTWLCQPYLFLLMVTTLELQPGSAADDKCPNNRGPLVTTDLYPGKAWAEVNFEEFDTTSDRVYDCPRCSGQGFGCFFFGEAHCPMTWHQAKQYCQQRGARLAEPTDEYMSRFIANIFPHEYPNNHISETIYHDSLVHGTYPEQMPENNTVKHPGPWQGIGWLGGYRDEDNVWKWASDSSRVHFDDWKEGEPSNKTHYKVKYSKMFECFDCLDYFDEGCMELVDAKYHGITTGPGNWNDADCKFRRYPICHIPPKKVNKEETLEEEVRRVFYYYNSVYEINNPSNKGYFLRTYLWDGSLDEIGGIDKVAKRIAESKDSDEFKHRCGNPVTYWWGTSIKYEYVRLCKNFICKVRHYEEGIKGKDSAHYLLIRDRPQMKHLFDRLIRNKWVKEVCPQPSTTTQSTSRTPWTQWYDPWLGQFPG